MIRFDNVTKRYPDGTVAVDSLTLTAETGKITVLVGPSGCGKTTSLRMINRMIEPSEGSIWLDDRDTSTIATHELRREIGYVIQHAGLFPHRTIVDNVATVPLLLGTNKKKARKDALELLERVGLDPAFAKRYPAQLSGGQQQRVGVARALAADPPVMLMDEPFSAVDPVVREQLQDEFLRLQGDLGKTIVFVTHDIDEAIKLGDQIAVLRVGGHLAQLASPSDLLARPSDAFVAGFVGRDRGYRALGFSGGQNLPHHQEPTVRMGERAGAGAEVGEWVLAVDGDMRPQGWVNTAQAAGREVADDMLYRGGTLVMEGGSLRAALDACLSSPSGRGVIVAEGDQLLGSVHLDEVVQLIKDQPGPVTSGGHDPGEPAGSDARSSTGPTQVALQEGPA
ncbi:MAG: ATP-binding cassette domain-containing protein [Terracoccus sp.]